jgi:hypothetical protein
MKKFLIASTMLTFAGGAFAQTTMPAHPDHIVVVVEENHSTSELLGGSQTPYLDSLTQQGAVIQGYKADTHPSEPNYFALFSGSTQGATTDGTYSETAPSLAGNLKAAGKTFTGYAESGSPQKHNPWESFADAQGTGADFSQFPTDFSKLPTVSFVSPNLQNDMHDGSVQQGDQWLKQNLDAYAQWAKTHNSELIIVADEDDGSGNNSVPAVVVGAGITPGATLSGGPTDHTALFHTIEDQAVGSASNTTPAASNTPTQTSTGPNTPTQATHTSTSSSTPTQATHTSTSSSTPTQATHTSTSSSTPTQATQTTTGTATQGTQTSAGSSGPSTPTQDTQTSTGSNTTNTGSTTPTTTQATQTSTGSNTTNTGSTTPTTTQTNTTGQGITPDTGLSVTDATGTQRTATLTGSESSTAGGTQSANTITPGQGTLTDASGTVWKIQSNGSIMNGDQYTPGGGGTSALKIINGQVYGEDNSGKGWFALSGDGQSWGSIPGPPGGTGTALDTTPSGTTPSGTTPSGTTPSGTTPSGTATASTTPGQTTSGQTVAIPPPSCGTSTANQFGVLPLTQSGTGQIMDANGNLFVPRGINVMNGNGNPSAATLKSMFPNINFVRLAIYSYDSPDSLAPYVNDLTSNGIVVELENHASSDGQNRGGSTGSIFSGQVLQTEQSWYASVAAAFKNNPYVWFGTNNEPSTQNASGQTDPAGLSHWQKTTYDSIRGTGNQSLLFLETVCWAEGGKPVCNSGFDPSVYSNMSNVAWDSHIYGWLTNYSTDQATNDQFVADNVSALSSIKSAGNTVMPVFLGEYGNSTTGAEIDQNGTQVVNAVNKAVSDGVAAGAAAWAWGSGGPGDGLTNGGGLSSYGQQVASAMTKGTPTVSVCHTPATTTASTTTSAAPSTATGQTSQPQSVVVQTGSGGASQTPNSTSPPSAQPNAQNDTVAAATGSSLQATSNASNAVDAAVNQAQAVQAQGGQFNASSNPGVQAVGAAPQ